MVKDKTRDTQQPLPNVQRRQLLKGLGAVPVVATLTPVSASAVSLLCTEKTPPPGLPSGVSAYDPGNTGVVYQCTNTNPANFGTPTGYSTTVDDPRNAQLVVTDVYTKESGSAALGDYTNGNTRQCVIYIDGSSQLTYQSNGVSTNPIAASCLISLGLT